MLASITFRVVDATGGTDLILSNVTLSDPNATRIDALINNGRVVIGGMPPCEAIISIPNITSTVTASAPIEIKNATNIGSCDLTLFFDPSVVRVSNVSGGDFDFISSNLENTTAGSIRIAAFQGPSAGLNGDVVVANVTFMAVGSVGSSTPLTLDVTTLKDASPACSPIPYCIENGTLVIYQCQDRSEDEGGTGGGGGTGYTTSSSTSSTTTTPAPSRVMITEPEPEPTLPAPVPPGSNSIESPGPLSNEEKIENKNRELTSMSKGNVLFIAALLVVFILGVTVTGYYIYYRKSKR